MVAESSESNQTWAEDEVLFVPRLLKDKSARYQIGQVVKLAHLSQKVAERGRSLTMVFIKPGQDVLGVFNHLGQIPTGANVYVYHDVPDD